MPGSEISFHLPYAAFLLLVLFLLLFIEIALFHYRKRIQESFASLPLLSRLTHPRSFILTMTKALGWLIVWTLACVALMGPFGNIRYSPLSTVASGKQRPVQHEVVFLIDTSASMLVPDGPDGETRLDEAKNIMEDIISLLRGDMVSLYAFTSELTPVVPSTLDYLFVRLSIRDLHVNEGDVGGTRLAPILHALKEEAFPEPTTKHYSVLIFSDGGDTQLETLTGEAKTKEIESILSAIPNPSQFHVRLFTIGLGTPTPQKIPHVTFEGQPVLSKLDPEILKQLATKGKGQFYAAADWTSWDLAQELVSQISEDSFQSEQLAERQVTKVKSEDLLIDLYYQIPLGVALLFYLINLLLPDMRRI